MKKRTPKLLLLALFALPVAGADKLTLKQLTDLARNPALPGNS